MIPIERQCDRFAHVDASLQAEVDRREASAIPTDAEVSDLLRRPGIGRLQRD